MATVAVPAKAAPVKASEEPIKSFVQVSLDWANGFYIMRIPVKATNTAPQSKGDNFSFNFQLAIKAVKTGLVQNSTDAFVNDMKLKESIKQTWHIAPAKLRTKNSTLTFLGIG